MAGTSFFLSVPQTQSPHHVYVLWQSTLYYTMYMLYLYVHANNLTSAVVLLLSPISPVKINMVLSISSWVTPLLPPPTRHLFAIIGFLHFSQSPVATPKGKLVLEWVHFRYFSSLTAGRPALNRRMLLTANPSLSAKKINHGKMKTNPISKYVL